MVQRLLSTPAIDGFFDARQWQILPFQRAAWQAYADGESMLIHAATGQGKTLAAWLGPLAEASDAQEPLRVLWLTPMRALAADTQAQLQAAADALQIPWQVGLRTGDSSSSQRSRQQIVDALFADSPPQAKAHLAPTIAAFTAQLDRGARQYNEMVTAAAQLVSAANSGSLSSSPMSQRRYRDQLSLATDRLTGWAQAFDELGRLRGA